MGFMSRGFGNMRARVKAAKAAGGKPSVAAPDDDPAVLEAIKDGRLTPDEISSLTPGQTKTAYKLMRVKNRAARAAKKGPGKAMRGPRGFVTGLAKKALAKSGLQKKGAARSWQSAVKIAKDLRGGKPAPVVDVARALANKKGIASTAFDIASIKQVAAASGADALKDMKDHLKVAANEVVAESAKAIADKAGLDYDRAKEIYDGQVGINAPDKLPTVKAPKAITAARAVNKVATFTKDSELAMRKQSPTGEADDDPIVPPPPVDPKIILAAAGVLLLLLVKG